MLCSVCCPGPGCPGPGCPSGRFYSCSGHFQILTGWGSSVPSKKLTNSNSSNVRLSPFAQLSPGAEKGKWVTIFTLIFHHPFSALPSASGSCGTGVAGERRGEGRIYSTEAVARSLDLYSRCMEMRVGVFNGVTLLCVLQRPPPRGLAQEPSLVWTPPSAWWLLHLLWASLSETHLPAFSDYVTLHVREPWGWFKPAYPWPTEALSLPYPPMSLSCSTPQMMPKLPSHKLL